LPADRGAARACPPPWPDARYHRSSGSQRRTQAAHRRRMTRTAESTVVLGETHDVEGVARHMRPIVGAVGLRQRTTGRRSDLPQPVGAPDRRRPAANVAQAEPAAAPERSRRAGWRQPGRGDAATSATAYRSVTVTGVWAKRSCSRCARPGCSSTASTRAPASTRCLVKVPWPAPISTTSSQAADRRRRRCVRPTHRRAGASPTLVVTARCRTRRTMVRKIVIRAP
jgi:hypothetical protein